MPYTIECKSSKQIEDHTIEVKNWIDVFRQFIVIETNKILSLGDDNDDIKFLTNEILEELDNIYKYNNSLLILINCIFKNAFEIPIIDELKFIINHEGIRKLKCVFNYFQLIGCYNWITLFKTHKYIELSPMDVIQIKNSFITLSPYCKNINLSLQYDEYYLKDIFEESIQENKNVKIYKI